MARKRKSEQADGTVELEPEAPVDVWPAEVRPIGGMVESKWSGIPVWECPRCRATTFERRDAAVHTCKEVRRVADHD